MLKHSEQRAHRLDALICHIIFIAIVIMVSIVLLGALATRSHVFYTSYTQRSLRSQNAAWLVQQCKSPEFYSNMKHHNSLCDEVVLEQADPIWLHALRDVFDSTSICGHMACEDRITAVLNILFGKGLLMLALFAFVMFILLLILVPCYRTVSTSAKYIDDMHAPLVYGQLQYAQAQRFPRKHVLYPRLQ
jgi:hypothetical protein